MRLATSRQSSAILRYSAAFSGPFGMGLSGLHNGFESTVRALGRLICLGLLGRL